MNSKTQILHPLFHEYVLVFMCVMGVEVRILEWDTREGKVGLEESYGGKLNT